MENDLNILVVEDNDMNFMLFEQILSALNIKTHRATSREDVFNQINDGIKFNLIIMDVKLFNGENGFRISEDLSLSQIDTPIIIVTADTFCPEIYNKNYSESIKDIIFKPFHIESLINSVNRNMIA